MKKMLLGFAILLSITLIVSGGEAQQDTDYFRVGDTPGLVGSTYGWRIDGRGSLVPVTANVSNVGASTQQVNYGFFTNITLGGTNKSSWGSVVSPMTDAADHVYPTDSGGNWKMYDDGDTTVGGGVETDVEFVFDGNAQDFHIALDDSADDLVIAYGATVGTDARITIVDDANNTIVWIGDTEAGYDNYIRFRCPDQDYYIGHDDSTDEVVFGAGSVFGASPCASIQADSGSPRWMVWHGIDAPGVKDIDYGSSDITDHEFNTDGGRLAIDGKQVTFDVATRKDSIGSWTDDTISVRSDDADTVLEIWATEAMDAILALKSDEGDDSGDTWQIKNDNAAASANQLEFMNDITGTSVAKVSITTAGLLSASGDVVSINHDASNTSISDVMKLQHDTTATAADGGDDTGLGAGMVWYLENASGTIEEHGSIDLVNTDATNATEDSSFVISQMTNGAVRETLRLDAEAGATTADVLQWTSNTTETNAIVDVMRIKLDTLGGGAIGANSIGAGISIQIDDAGGVEEQASWDYQLTDSTDAAEDCDVILNQNVAGSMEARVLFDADGPNVHLKGTTPYLTIGDAGAEDTKLVFDGNAQDFYVGLDDTDDELKIGLGSAVGTTTAIEIEADLGVNIKQELRMEDDNRLLFGASDDIAAGYNLQYIEFDNGVDDQFLFVTEATKCVATTDPVFEFLCATGTSAMTENQEVFGIAKGSQASNTRIFAVDEDGDIFVTGDIIGAATGIIVNTQTSKTHKYMYMPLGFRGDTTPEVANAYPLQSVGLDGVREIGTAEGYVLMADDADQLRFRFGLPPLFSSGLTRASADVVFQLDLLEADDSANASLDVTFYERGVTATALFADTMHVSDDATRAWTDLYVNATGIFSPNVNDDDIITVVISPVNDECDFRVYGARIKYRVGIQVTQ